MADTCLSEEVQPRESSRGEAEERREQREERRAEREERENRKEREEREEKEYKRRETGGETEGERRGEE